MLIIEVEVKVKSEFLEKFIAATKENAAASAQEPGVARFDFLQSNEDPTQFVLIEVYRNTEAPAKHKETTHYNTWRTTVEEMMAQSRKSRKLNNIFPPDSNW